MSAALGPSRKKAWKTASPAPHPPCCGRCSMPCRLREEAHDGSPESSACSAPPGCDPRLLPSLCAVCFLCELVLALPSMTMCSDCSACSQAASRAAPRRKEPPNTMVDRPTTAARRRSPVSTCLRPILIVRARALLDAVDREELGEQATPPGARCARYGARIACSPLPPHLQLERASLHPLLCPSCNSCRRPSGAACPAHLVGRLAVPISSSPWPCSPLH